MGEQFLQGQAASGRVLTSARAWGSASGGGRCRICRHSCRAGSAKRWRRDSGSHSGSSSGAASRRASAWPIKRAAGSGEGLCGGVNGGQVIFHRGGGIVEQSIFRMVDLEPRGTGASFAEGAHTGAGVELLLLGRGKMKKAQAENAGAVAQAHQQAAAAAPNHLRGRHLAFHYRFAPGAQGSNGGHAGTVLIAQRQVKQQVGHGVDPQAGQFQCQRLADALEVGNGGVEFAHAKAGSCARQCAMALVTASMAWGSGSWRARRSPRCVRVPAVRRAGWSVVHAHSGCRWQSWAAP